MVESAREGEGGRAAEPRGSSPSGKQVEVGTSDEDNDPVDVAARGGDGEAALSSSSKVTYKLYKRRWLGLASLCVLTILVALNWIFFAYVADLTAAAFGISLTRVNWLGNIVNAMYIIAAWFVPPAVNRFGLRGAVLIGSVSILVGVWIRYAAIFVDSQPNTAYVLLIIGQTLVGICQPFYLCLGTRFSENWFNERGRTTATGLAAIANPFGAAIGGFIAPAIAAKPSDMSTLLLTTAILTTALLPLTFFVWDKPPTPPTFSSTEPSQPLFTALSLLLGFRSSTTTTVTARPTDAVAEKREGGESTGELEPGEGSVAGNVVKGRRRDFWIICACFSVLVGAFDAWATLLNQIFEPYGYSDNASGYFGAAALLSGLVAAVVTAPLFDKVFSRHLVLTIKSLVPVLAASYIAFIFVVKRDDIAGIYFVLILIGVCSFVLLPIALEVTVDLTRPAVSAETSSALLWIGGQVCGVVFIEVMDALREGDSPMQGPALNMRRSLIFQASPALLSYCGGALAVVVAVVSVSIFFLRARSWRGEPAAALSQ